MTVYSVIKYAHYEGRMKWSLYYFKGTVIICYQHAEQWESNYNNHWRQPFDLQLPEEFNMGPK